MADAEHGLTLSDLEEYADLLHTAFREMLLILDAVESDYGPKHEALRTTLLEATQRLRGIAERPPELSELRHDPKVLDLRPRLPHAP